MYNQEIWAKDVACCGGGCWFKFYSWKPWSLWEKSCYERGSGRDRADGTDLWTKINKIFLYSTILFKISFKGEEEGEVETESPPRGY